VSNAISPPDAWRAELMRLTAFPAPPLQPANIEAWWLALFGAPHERSNQDLKKGVTRLLGSVNDAFMVATQNPISFELRQRANDPAQPPPATDTLPLYSDVVPAFRACAQRWLKLDDCPPLRRLAFGATLLRPVASLQDGYEILNSCLPDVRVDPQSNDFLYQINRRRSSSTVDGLLLNRLSKWSTEQLQEVVFSADGNLIRESGTFACRLELDMNSVPSQNPLPRASLPALFEEFVQFADEVAVRGDVP
jgi:hypothetical protein